jgi:hypothetical protein
MSTIFQQWPNGVQIMQSVEGYYWQRGDERGTVQAFATLAILDALTI